MFSAVSNNWHSLGNVQYEKIELYSDVKWGNDENSKSSIRLDQYVIEVANNAGPIAMIRDENTRPKSTSNYLDKSNRQLRIFSASGNLISERSFPTSKGEEGRLVKLGWTANEMLVTVQESGLIKFSDINVDQAKQVQLFTKENNKVSETISIAVIHSHGVIAVTSDLRFIAVSNASSKADNVFHKGYKLDLNVFYLQSAPIRQLRPQPYVTALEVIDHSEANGLELIVALSNKELWKLSENNAHEVLSLEPLNSPAIALSLSPGGGFVACYTASGLLLVFKDDLTNQIMEFETRSKDPPKQLVWCGQDCVLMHWPGLGILMVGPGEHFTNLYYAASNPLVLAPEIDCCRIITQFSIELLQRVPESIEAICNIGSTDPAAMLFDAMEAFQDGDPKADDHIRAMTKSYEQTHSVPGIEIGEEPKYDSDDPSNEIKVSDSNESKSAEKDEEAGVMLRDAVTACINAAAAQFDSNEQKALLRAASYGKSFLSDFDSEDFVACCRKLRVLNALRDRKVGMPLTSYQYDLIGSNVILEMLVRRKMYKLALQVCKHLKISCDAVVLSWACEKISKPESAEMSDESLKSIILKKFIEENVGSYAEVARTATSIKRQKLAKIFLELEPNSRRQVELLCELGEYESATKKAISSGNFDLIAFALLSAEEYEDNESNVEKKDKTQTSNLFQIAFNYPEALNVLKAYYYNIEDCGETAKIQKLLSFKDLLIEKGAIATEKAYEESNIGEHMAKLDSALSIYSKSKELNFYYNSTKEQIELMKEKSKLEEEFALDKEKKFFAGCSLYETVSKGIVISANKNMTPKDRENLTNAVLKLAKKYKMSDKCICHLRVKSLASIKHWEQLKEMSNERKSPIGYEPFARAAIDGGLLGPEVDIYTDRMPYPEEKYDLYLESKSWLKAAETALRLKDAARFEEVRRLAQSSQSVLNDIDNLVSRGGFK